MKQFMIFFAALLGVAALQAAEPVKDTVAVAPPTIKAIKPLVSSLVVDTLATDNEALSVVLFNDGTWRYVQKLKVEQDSTVYNRYWDTSNISAYKSVKTDSLPSSVAINLVDSLKSYRYPYIGRVTSRYGMRHRRAHNGIDIALTVGDTICFHGFTRCTS